MTRKQKYSDLRCGEVREGLSAMFDRETDEIESEALLAHLEGCEECASYQRQLGRLHTRLCDELTDTCNVDQIWERVEWGIEAIETRPSANAQASPKKWWNFAGAQRVAAAALAAMLLLGVIIGDQKFWPADSKGLPLVTETIRDFETFRLRGGLLDVAAREPNVVRQWMAAKIDFKLPEDVNPPAGFRIAGGRLCSFLNRRLAFFHYEKGTAALSLYVMKASGLKLPGNGSFDVATSTNQLTTVTWADQGLAYVVVSGLPASEVTAFASRLMRQAPMRKGEQL